MDTEKHRRLPITRSPLIKALLRSRWPQLSVTALALAGFVLAIVAALVGTPVGSRNFGIVFVWIAWWALLMLIAVPFFGRGWCSICPIPAPGEWLQRGAVLGPTGAGGLGRGRRWPNRLRNIWLQNGAFVLVALFSAVVLTQPRVTGLVLAAFLLLAVGTSLIYERRAFCRYLCPVGGFIGLYSQLAPIELRVSDAAVCAAHKQKTCYTGDAQGFGCPWQVFPGGLTKNTYCGTCMECLRTCPHDNLVINLRPFGADLAPSARRRMDEAYKAFIMLGSALAYSAVMLGPWGWLKSAAYEVGSLAWAGYAAAFLVAILVALPGLFYLAVALGRELAGRSSGRSMNESRKAFVALAYCLVPLGLAAWIAFSLSFVFANLSYLLPALSDPMGWGWNLFSTAEAAWTPYLSRVVPIAQAAVLLGGLIWASVVAYRTAGRLQAGVSRSGSGVTPGVAAMALPVIACCALVTFGMLGLLIG